MSYFIYPLQKVLASRKELLEYDLQQREAVTKSSRSTTQPTFTASQYRALSVLGCGHTSSTKCYGCASAVTGHCITLLRALATNTAIRQILVLQGLIRELFEYNLRRGTSSMREEVRQLICLLTRYSHAQMCFNFLLPLKTIYHLLVRCSTLKNLYGFWFPEITLRLLSR